TVSFEVEHIGKDGVPIPVEISAGKVADSGKEYMIAFVRDITKRKQREARIEFMSYHDALTGLYNRRYAEEKLTQLDESMLPVSIIMGDLNGLKIINNSHGHSKGDEILIKAANILEKVTPPEAVVARFGGDEFVILLPETDNRKGYKVLELIKSKCRETESDDFPVSIGLGVATMTDFSQNLREVFKKADREMNQNKLLEIRSSNNKIIQGMLSALGAKSDETRDHTQRMSSLAQKIGRKMGLANSELNRLSLLATLHDIGKTSIPEEVLVKAGPLSHEEWEMITGHPARGYKIAAATNEFSVVAEEILSHHERWDGSGYPRELDGEKIPYLARIISIVDAYDVMTSGRTYQAGISKQDALTEIKRCAGSQFDPVLAQEFVILLNDE
ncbi:MAG: sensor domain-containing diguanylate cyclase/phosphohydrolase, partial [Bacillota bacterium]